MLHVRNASINGCYFLRTVRHLRLTLVYCGQHEESMGGRGTITYVCDDSPVDGLGYGDICKVETNTPGTLNPVPLP